MSNDFYNSLAETGKELIDEYGGNVTLERITGEIINPVTGKITEGTNDSKITKGLLLNYKDSLIDGTMIKLGDRLLLINNSIIPLKTDKPQMNNEYLGSIENIKTIIPNGIIPLVYFLQVRK